MSTFKDIDNTFAYVSQLHCGCVNFAATVSYTDRHITDFDLRNLLARGLIRAVTIDEWNKLKMKCEHCYRKDS